MASGEGASASMLKAGNYELPAVAEALTIRKTDRQKKPVWVISGFDNRGLMYGLLDVAKRISWSKNRTSPFSEVKDITEKPAVSDRAISIYTMNRAYWESRVQDERYWARYLDMLAENRFNTLVIIFGYENGGFLAPCYPYFFNVEGFPGVEMVGITKEQQQRNLTAFNRLIKMTHDRGIRFTVGIWDHIYRGGVQGGGIPGTKDSPDKPGKDYMRLTHFNDYEGGKASNPVVSTDGKYMAFRSANTNDPAGVGYGILLYTFKK